MAKRDNVKARTSGRTTTATRSSAAKAVATREPAGAAARGTGKGRSGGAVDAPGKKHRKQLPTDPDANIADSQAAKRRTGLTMAKTNRRRGRG